MDMNNEEQVKDTISENKEQTEDINTSQASETSKATEESPVTEQKEDKEESLEEKLAHAEEEIESLKDQLLRKAAEFDNYRKRTIKEKTELILNGGEKTIVAILPVLDDIERALKTMENAENVQAVADGVNLIYKKFIDILGKQGVKAIETKEVDFDVELHEAIAQLPAPTEELKGKVLDCTLTGYQLNDKVIRHSQVVVGL